MITTISIIMIGIIYMYIRSNESTTKKEIEEHNKFLAENDMLKPDIEWSRFSLIMFKLNYYKYNLLALLFFIVMLILDNLMN